MSTPRSDETTGHRGILAWWAGNSIAANLLMIIAIIGGIAGYLSMQRLDNPAAEFPGATVNVSWQGASPQEVEEQILLRIEEAMADLDGVRRITATAVEGSGWVNIEGNNNIDATYFFDQVKLRVDSINNLPRDAFRPVVTQWRMRNQIAGIALHGHVDRRELQRLAREIRNEIGREVPEAASIQIQASLAEEVAVEVSEENLRRYGLTFNELAQAIGSASMNTSAGSVRTDLGDVRIASRQLADTAEEFGSIIVRQSPDGGVIRVRDVATVIDGVRDVNLDATFDGEPMVLITLMSTGNSDVIRVSNQLKAYMDRKRDELPETISMSEWWDSADQFNSQLTVIGGAALTGLALVLVVLVLFLRPIVAFWVTIGIATAFAGSFLLLPLMGVTLNFLSLFAFLIVIGVIVDDAIIVGENIHNRVERGEQGLTAAVVGVQMVAKPIVFAVITSMLAFAPWMLLSGPESQFTSQISLVVIAALTFSLIESLLILPAHLAHIKPQKAHGFWGGVTLWQARIADSIVWFARKAYAPLLALTIKHRYATLALFIGLFATSIVLMASGRVPFRFMPEIESDMIQVNIQLAEGTAWGRTSDIRERLEDAELEVQTAYREEFPGQLDMIRNRSTLATDGRIRAWITLAPPEIRPGRVPSADIAQRIRDAMGEIPDAEEVRFDATINEVGPAIDYAINHQDLDVLRAAADDLSQALRGFPAAYDVIDNLQTSAEELRLTLRPDARALGLTLADVTSQVRQAFYGLEVQRLPRGGEDVQVMVRYPRDARNSLDAVNNLRIRTPDGREIPLAAVAEAQFAPGISRIQRRERQRTVRVSAELTDPDEARNIRRQLDEDFFPQWRERHPGVTIGAIGQAEGEAEFMSEIMGLQAMMLLLMYALLAVAFRSYAQPLLIMTAIPFAFAGAVFGHILLGVPFALFSFFGVGAAAGIVINDNLVLVDFVNRLRDRGAGAFQALIDAGVQRFRPILLTTVTTFLGVFPMILERSTSAQFLKPMVIALGFAVIFALFLTLFLVPALYAIGVDIKRGVTTLWTGKKKEGIGAGWSGEQHADEIDVGAQPAE